MGITKNTQELLATGKTRAKLQFNLDWWAAVSLTEHPAPSPFESIPSVFFFLTR